MSYAALIVPGMNDPRRFDVIVTITREDGNLPGPAKVAVAARHAASGRAVDGDLMFAYTAQKVITSVVVAGTPDACRSRSRRLGRGVRSAAGGPQPSRWLGRRRS
jgi:hypothetical protein